MMRFQMRITATLAVAAGLAVSTSAAAQDVAQFYAGARLTLVTSASTGGGYDQYARLLAKHMPRFIPGTPSSIIVQNMVGAEGIKAANYLYTIAAKDGSIVGGLQRNNGVASFYDPENKAIQFDARKFHWLGSMQQEAGLLLVNASTGVKTAADLKGKALTASSTARGSPASIYPRLLNEFYGANFKVVEGYGGSQEALLAVERAEVDSHVSGGSSAAFRSRISPWLKSGKTGIIVVMAMERDPEFKDVPTVLEILPTAEAKKLFEIALVEQVMGRPFLMPPSVPADRVKAMRAAFDATLKDKEFLAEAKSMKVEIDAVDGQTINGLLDKVYSTPPDLANRIRALIK